MLPTRTALHCLARTACINAAVTARGMQEIGLLYVLEPGLTCLYDDAHARARAFARYGGHSNTHVFMVPLYAGIILALESQIAQGSMPENAAETVRETLATTLSAMGDSLFSGSLLPFWALSTTCLVLAEHTAWAVAFSLLMLALLFFFRIWSFFAGLRYGLSVLITIRRCNPIHWGAYLKGVNAVLLAAAVWQLPLEHWQPFSWMALGLAAAAILTAAWLVGRMRLPRLLLWALVLGVLILMDVGLIAM